QGNNEDPGAGEGTTTGSDADSGTRKLARENGDVFGMSTSYDFDFGLSMGAAYSSSDRTDNQVARGRGDGHHYSGYRSA
ncbi:porin, partial [Salmonella enterica subsp. enterica serovar Infantis]